MDSLPQSERYGRRSDGELEDLHAQGAHRFLPEAWEDLGNEIARRQANETWHSTQDVSPQPVAEETSQYPEFAGWLGFFTSIMWMFVAGGGVSAVVSLVRGDFLRAALALALAITSGIGLQFHHRRDVRTPVYWHGLMVVFALGAGTGALADLQPGEASEGAFVPLVVTPAVAASPWVIWALYWRRSRRVHSVFGQTSERSTDGSDP